MRAPLSFFVPGLIGVVSTFSLAASAAAQAPAEHDHSGREQYHVEARHASRAPAIDGVLDEPIWGDAAMLDNFTQQEPILGAPTTVSGLRLVDARASYGIGLETFALGFPIHFDWSWRTLFNRDWEDVVYGLQGGSDWFRRAKFSVWIGYDF